MNGDKFQIFMKEGCTKSKEIISLLNKNNFNTEVINVMDKDGFELARKNSIMKLPTILLLSTKGKVVDRLYILSEIKNLINSFR